MNKKAPWNRLRLGSLAERVCSLSEFWLARLTKDLEQRSALLAAMLMAGALADAPRAQSMVPAMQPSTTLEIHLVDERHSPSQAQKTGEVPPGDKIYPLRGGGAILLKRDAVVTSDEIVDVTEDTTQQAPTVNIRLDARGSSSMHRATSENFGHRMAVVYSGVVIRAPVIRGVFGGEFALGDLAAEEARSLVARFHKATK